MWLSTMIATIISININNLEFFLIQFILQPVIFLKRNCVYLLLSLPQHAKNDKTCSEEADEYHVECAKRYSSEADTHSEDAGWFAYDR